MFMAISLLGNHQMVLFGLLCWSFRKSSGMYLRHIISMGMAIENTQVGMVFLILPLLDIPPKVRAVNLCNFLLSHDGR